MVFVIRHAERLDRADPSWSAQALRPQDTPLSETGKHQARRKLYHTLMSTDSAISTEEPLLRSYQVWANGCMVASPRAHL
jgi:broad specificity phosphatase PhoE